MTEVMQDILTTVSEVTGTAEDKIISKCRREDYVLARKIFVNLCFKYGFATAAISDILCYTNKGIRNLYVQSFDEETRYIYRKYYEEINTKLKLKYSCRVALKR